MLDDWKKNLATYSSDILRVPLLVRPKRVWLFGYVWLFGVWLFGGSTVSGCWPISTVMILFLTSFSKCGVNFIRYGESVVRCEISDQDCRETQSRRDAKLIYFNFYFKYFKKFRHYHPITFDTGLRLTQLTLPSSKVLVQNFGRIFQNSFRLENWNR